MLNGLNISSTDILLATLCNCSALRMVSFEGSGCLANSFITRSISSFVRVTFCLLFIYAPAGTRTQVVAMARRYNSSIPPARDIVMILFYINFHVMLYR